MFRKASEFKLFYASDLHGSERCFLKFVNAAKFYGVQALVLGGDLTGKAVVPIIRQQGGRWQATFLEKQYDLGTEAELQELEKAVRFNGFYPYRTDPDEVQHLQSDPRYLKEIFDRLMRQSVERWISIAHERLSGTGVGFYAIAGNDDEFFVDDALTSDDFVAFNDSEVVEIGPCQMIGYSYANPTPWKSPRELPEDALYERMREMVQKLDPSRPAVLNFHVPPHKTGLDNAPEVKPDLTYNLIGGQPNVIPVGSQAVRRIFEEVQPVLGLHGHIHESKAAARIGRSLVLNPGSRYGEGVLDGALVTLTAQGAVKAYQFVAG